MKLFLDEFVSKATLLPFSLTRHVADIRIGILTIREKWQALSHEIEFVDSAQEAVLTIDAAAIPNLENYQQLVTGNISYDDRKLQYPWQISQWNEWAIRKDFKILTADKKSSAIPPTVKIISPETVFIEEGAVLNYCIINANTGPVYIGKNAEIMEGVLIRGPVAICEGAIIKMGTKIYPGTTIGPYCIAGGEIKNSMMFSYSNKAHDGYLGDSVIGEWCNLGAGTSNSNLKNTGGNVRYKLSEKLDCIEVGTKAGLLMGDYSRAAINTSFNTGSVVGVCCNIFSERNPPVFIPNFTWANEKYILEKAFCDIDNWKKMKGQAITEAEKNILQQLYNQ